MKRVKAVIIRTKYWRPGENFLDRIVDAVKDHIEEGDIVTVSEKAISTAKGNIIDEDRVKPGRMAHLIAKYWMRYIWGYLLGILCHLKHRNLRNLRNYPLDEGSKHKQVALTYAGPLQALQWGSEGGIDGSNLPFTYVSLPLKEPYKVAEEIRRHIEKKLSKKVTVMIIDTDKTYTIGRIHFTPHPNPINGIRSFGSVIAYIIGRALKLKRRSTPIAITGSRIEVDLALNIAELVNRCRGSGAGATVWDMARRFNVPLTEVTWEMLEKIDHKPIVIIREIKKKGL